MQKLGSSTNETLEAVVRHYLSTPSRQITDDLVSDFIVALKGPPLELNGVEDIQVQLRRHQGLSLALRSEVVRRLQQAEIQPAGCRGEDKHNLLLLTSKPYLAHYTLRASLQRLKGISEPPPRLSVRPTTSEHKEKCLSMLSARPQDESNDIIMVPSTPNADMMERVVSRASAQIGVLSLGGSRRA